MANYELVGLNEAGPDLRAPTSSDVGTCAGAIYPSIGVYIGGGASANLLDDYEEGTWTPTISFGGASVGTTYSAQIGRYTKIGNLVTATCNCVLSAKGSSTGDAVLNGLPFTSANISSNRVTCSIRTAVISFADIVYAYNDPNTATIILQESTNAGSISALTDADFGNTSQVQISISYYV